LAALLGLAPAAPGQLHSPLPRVAIVSSRVTVERLKLAREAASPPRERSGIQNWSFFFQELRRLGFREDESVIVDLWSMTGIPNAQRAAAISTVLATSPDVIVADSEGLVIQLKAATAAVPIVAMVADPIADGIVSNLARPEANITGFGDFETDPPLVAKRIQLLVDLAPAVRRVAYAGLRERFATSVPFPSIIAELAGSGIEMVVIPVDRATSNAPGDLDRWRLGLVASILRERCAGLVYQGNFATGFGCGATGPGGVCLDDAVLAGLLLQAGIATGGGNVPFVFAGGLMAYTHERREQYVGMADYVVRILSGARPGDLPFQLPTKHELFINGRTADALDLVIPEHLRVMATEIIG
jgi:putative ABC transport system substrate-binding protein